MKKKRSKKPDPVPVGEDNQNHPSDDTGPAGEESRITETNAPPQSSAEVDQLPEDATVPMERLLRLQADFDNYRKRTARDHKALIDRATENLMLELLPVLDNFDIALKHTSEQSRDSAMLEGFRIVAEQLESVLKKFGLQPVPAEDVPFDPHQHEAVAHVPDPDRDEGMIVAQTRRGFRLGDRLLRASQVVVSSGTPATREEHNAESVEVQED